MRPTENRARVVMWRIAKPVHTATMSNAPAGPPVVWASAVYGTFAIVMVDSFLKDRPLRTSDPIGCDTRIR